MSLIFLPLTVLIAFTGYPESYKESREPGFGFSYKNVPLDIVQHLKAHKYQGVVMNHYNDGAYIIYYNYPEVKTLMDSRTEVYGRALFEEQQKSFLTYEAFKNYVYKYKADFVMVQISQSVLRQYLFKDPNWILEKTGLTHDLFRKVGSNESGIQRQVYDTKKLDEKGKYCVFIRLFGGCHEAPECQTECNYNDATIVSLLKLSDPNCIKFSQTCFFNKQAACGHCRDFCDYYKSQIPKINDELGSEFKPALSCR